MNYVNDKNSKLIQNLNISFSYEYGFERQT